MVNSQESVPTFISFNSDSSPPEIMIFTDSNSNANVYELQLVAKVLDQGITSEPYLISIEVLENESSGAYTIPTSNTENGSDFDTSESNGEDDDIENEESESSIELDDKDSVATDTTVEDEAEIQLLNSLLGEAMVELYVDQGYSEEEARYTVKKDIAQAVADSSYLEKILLQLL